MAGQVCLPLSSDEERQVPSVKTDIFNWLGQVTEIISGG